jgi:type IV pilus assembly protein PilF
VKGPVGMRSSFRAGLLAAAFPAFLALATSLPGCSTTHTVDGTRVADNTPLSGGEGDVHQRSAARLRLAASYYQNGQLQVAVDAARKALELDPAAAPAHAFLGILLLDLGQVESAQASFQRAMALDHDSSDIANNYGWFLCRTGRVHEALPYFEKAAADRLYATPGQALLNAGICQMQQGELDAAEKLLLRALAADATLVGVKYRLSELYLRERRLERADFYFDLLVKAGANGADTVWLGIRIAHSHGDSEAEHRLVEDLRARFPESREVDLVRRGDYRE